MIFSQTIINQLVFLLIFVKIIHGFQNHYSYTSRIWADSKWYSKCNSEPTIDHNNQTLKVDDNNIHYIQFMTSEMFKEVFEIQRISTSVDNLSQRDNTNHKNKQNKSFLSDTFLSYITFMYHCDIKRTKLDDKKVQNLGKYGVVVDV